MTRKRSIPVKLGNDPLHLEITETTKPEDIFRYIDREFQAQLAKITGGISPAGIRTAYVSWLAQLSQSPGRLLRLWYYWPLHSHDFLQNLLNEQQPANGEDVRFKSEQWQAMPWRLYAELFLSVEDFWHVATVDVPGVSTHTESVISFCTRQLMDAVSPANFVLTNPDLFYETWRLGGTNLIRGTEIAIRDISERLTGSPPPSVDQFIPGIHVAITPGKVVFQNHLIELLQYDAQTTTVYKEPILILPAWIMKYYILDLQPYHSMVKWLVEQGHTVFMVSWRNPTREDRNLGMDDYYRLGAMDAIDVVSRIRPKAKINLMGYCLGGTLAMITAAAMGRNGDERLNSLTLLAAQGDFTEAGELMLFINKSEISFLENMMWDQGYLDTKQMSGSFQMLRSYDLIWSKMIQDYMHGEERGMIDLLAWNADATRMPYKMHSEYLEKLFLNNDLAAGRFTIDGMHIAANNIHIPVFVVSTEKDHVAPWKSVYKLHLMINSPLTFVLTNGGHNAGIISEPNHAGRTYRIHERKRRMAFVGPEQWFDLAEKKEGSWWIAWNDWLILHATKRKILAPKINHTLPKAPGTYILQK